jgi:stearoyl-CoA desaturase (delta-9 desaturase)
MAPVIASDNLDALAKSNRVNHAAPALSIRVQIMNLVAILLPFAGLIVAVVVLWGRGFDWLQLGLLVGMYFVTGLGITVGFHRLFTHRAFETSRPVRFALAVAGCMAVQGPILQWVATHRRHHQHSDLADDPHSPHHHGRGLRGLLRGIWHSHIGWMFRPDAPELLRYAGDLAQDGLIRKVSALFALWVVLGLAIPAALGGLLTQSWTGAVLGFIWGGLVRVFFVHHVTWSINSVCHLWGSRPFHCKDESRNNLLFGLLAWGEGWHNNHHAFPTSARHGLRWWEFDVSFLVIRAGAALGLAWDVRIPAAQTIAARRVEAVKNDRRRVAT